MFNLGILIQESKGMLLYPFPNLGPVLYVGILATGFFWSLVLLDRLMEKTFSPNSRVAISHIFMLFFILAIMCISGGPTRWGVNLKHWQTSLVLGLFLGLTVGILFSLISYGTNITQWTIANVITRLGDRQNLILLLSQILVVGTSEELFFRGILVTYLSEQYSTKLAGLQLAVIIVSTIFALIQLYKLLMGATLEEILPFVIGALIYGLILGGVYQKTGSLLGPITLHNLGNSCMELIGLGIYQVDKRQIS